MGERRVRQVSGSDRGGGAGGRAGRGGRDALGRPGRVCGVLPRSAGTHAHAAGLPERQPAAEAARRAELLRTRSASICGLSIWVRCRGLEVAHFVSTLCVTQLHVTGRVV